MGVVYIQTVSEVPNPSAIPAPMSKIPGCSASRAQSAEQDEKYERADRQGQDDKVLTEEAVQHFRLAPPIRFYLLANCQRQVRGRKKPRTNRIAKRQVASWQSHSAPKAQ